MSDDWKVGDLAVCVENGCLGRFLPRRELKIGHSYRVIGLCIAEPEWGYEPSLMLDGVLLRASQRRFRKIRPDQHKACEPEFVTLLNRIKRKVDA